MLLGLVALAAAAATLDYAASARKFTAALQRDPTDTRARYNLAVCLYMQHQPRAAAETLAPLIGADRPDSDALNLFAAAQHELRNLDAALHAYRRAIELYPSSVCNYEDLARLCLQRNALDVAAEVLTSAIANQATSMRVYLLRASVNARSGRIEQAARDYDAAARLQTGRLYDSVGLHPDDPPAAVEHRLAATPDDAVLNFLLADALMRAGAQPGQPAFQSAVNALRRALFAQPDFAPAHIALAALYGADHKETDALVELELAVRSDARDPEAWAHLALAAQSAGRTQQARQAEERVRAIAEQYISEEIHRERPPVPLH